MSSPRIYNPAQLSGADLEQSFVARQEALADILRTIREQATDAPCQHTLLIGPRGMGKTTMGLMCLRRIEQDPALAARWQPVPFHEESYGIGDLADLWLSALRHLAHATGESLWTERADALATGEPDVDRQAAYALAALLDFHHESGKRLVLFIENLDQVLAQIGDERQIHALRAALIQRPEILLLGSANTVFNAIRSHSEPFYEFFRLVFLRGLDAGETRLLLKAVVGEQSPDGSLNAMVAETGRLETIRHLTGGNPRLLRLACRMMVESPLGTAFDDLEQLIDEQTPYFKAQIEELPPQLRRVFHCLAEGWRPLLAKEVAAASKLTSSHASAQLRQLVEKGYAKERRLPNSKRAHYEVVDRFYNIYYLLRLSHRSRGRFKRLLQFLQDLFGVVGMRTLYEAALPELREGAPEKEALISVLAERVAGDDGFDGRAGWLREAADLAGDPVLQGWCLTGIEQLRASRFDEAAATFGDLLTHATGNSGANQFLLLFPMAIRISALFLLGKYDVIAEDEYLHLAEEVCLNENVHVRGSAALYFLYRGQALEKAERPEEADEAWLHCASLIEVCDPPAYQSTAATALFYSANSCAERGLFSETMTITRRAWEYDCTDVPKFHPQMAVPLMVSARWLLVELDSGVTERPQATDLAEAERYARRAWEYSPNAVTSHVLADVLGRQGRWKESLTHLAKAASWSETDPGLGGLLADSFIRTLAAGHAGVVKDILANATLEEPIEPLWHATRAELGEEIEPLPAEVADAVAAVRAKIERIRAGNSPTGGTASNPRRRSIRPRP